jgi:tripartite-type tricarboxylate transporter receptor subunit TctC
MGAVLGRQIVVENRGGAGGSIGAAELARSAADGLTVMADAMAHAVNPSRRRSAPRAMRRPAISASPPSPGPRGSS